MSITPSPEDLKKWHRYFAIEANNASWTLAEKDSLDVESKSRLMLLAATSAHHWFEVGNASNIALAHQLVGWVHARLGHAELALFHAEKAYASLSEREAPAWEVAFCHAILSAACGCAGDATRQQEHHRKAKEVGEGLEPEDREIFMATFRLVPEPV